MRKKRRLKRMFSFLFLVMYVTNHLYTIAYAATATPATASNAEFTPLIPNTAISELQSMELSTYSAVSPSLSLSPSSYVLSLLLNSMGVDVSLSSLASWCGVTETYEEFCDLGAKDQLSAWEQWCYNQGNSDGAEALRESYNKNVGWLSSLGWDVTVPVDDLSTTAESMQTWLKSMPTYGTDVLNYTVYRKAYSVPIAEYTGYPNLAFRNRNDYLLYLASSEADVYVFFVKSISKLSGKYMGSFYAFSVKPFTYEYINSNGSLKQILAREKSMSISGVTYTYYQATEGGNMYGYEGQTWLPYEYIDAASDESKKVDEVAKSFLIANGAQELNSVYAQTLPAQKVNPLLAKANTKFNGFELPANEDNAKQQLENIDITSNTDDIIKALVAAGLVIKSDITDETTTPDEGDIDSISVSLKTIINKIEQIIQVFSEWNFVDWSGTLNNVLINAMTSLGLDSISRAIDDIGKWNFADWPLQLSDTLKDTMKSLGLDSISHVLEDIGKWNFADWPLQLNDILNDTMKSLGLDSVSHALENIGKWDFADWPLSLSNSVKEAIDTLDLGGIISVLEDILDNILSIPESLSSSLSDVLGLTDGFSLSSALDRIIELIIALPESIGEELSIEPEKSTENQEDDFVYFFKFIIALVLIIVLLIIIFINCLRLIIAIFNIPASTVLFNEYVLKGLQFTKDLQLPIMGVSLYSLLTGLGFFLCIISIIGLLRRKADKLHE